MEAITADERTVLREKIIRSANDKLGNHLAELLQFLLAGGLHVISSVCVTTSNDSVLKVLPKIVLRPQEIRICKAKQRKVFRKIILRWGSARGPRLLSIELIPGWVYQRVSPGALHEVSPEPGKSAILVTHMPWLNRVGP